MECAGGDRLKRGHDTSRCAESVPCLFTRGRYIAPSGGPGDRGGHEKLSADLVLQEILGMNESEIERLRKSGIIEPQIS